MVMTSDVKVVLDRVFQEPRMQLLVIEWTRYIVYSRLARALR